MFTRNKQNGMTFWGLMVVAALFIFFVILFLKLLPPYMEHAKARTALENLAKQPDAGTMEKAQIKAALERRFNIDEVNEIDLKTSLFVEKKPGVLLIRLAYEKRVPLAYNITALIDFDDTVQVNAR